VLEGEWDATVNGDRSLEARQRKRFIGTGLNDKLNTGG